MDGWLGALAEMVAPAFATAAPPHPSIDRSAFSKKKKEGEREERGGRAHLEELGADARVRPDGARHLFGVFWFVCLFVCLFGYTIVLLSVMSLQILMRLFDMHPSIHPMPHPTPKPNKPSLQKTAKASAKTPKRTSETSASVASQSAEMELMEETRWAKNALATSLESSELQRLVVRMRSRGTQCA